MATTYTTIQVTQADIDNALRRKSARCVLATAIARSIPGATRVDVDLQTIRFTIPGESRSIYLTPPAATGYVIAFDAGDEIHPFSFRLSERHRVRPRTDKRTDAGKERMRTAQNERSAEKKLMKAQTQRADLSEHADPTDVAVAEREVKAAKTKLTRRKRERQETVARLEGQPHTEPDLTPDPETGTRAPKPPARAFKYGTRAYGHRDLRINQDEPTAENTAARRSVMAVYDDWSQDEADL